MHVLKWESGSTGFNFSIYYNYNDYKLTDYKSTFDEGAVLGRWRICWPGKREPRAQKMKTCSQAENQRGVQMAEIGSTRLLSTSELSILGPAWQALSYCWRWHTFAAYRL